MATVFETMMKVGFDNSIFDHLKKLSLELTAIHTLAGNIGTKIGGWKTALGVVGGAVIFGATIKAMEDLVKHGNEVNKQLNLMEGKGYSEGERALARKLAFKASTQVPGSTPAKNLEHMNELLYVFGDYPTMAPVFNQIETMNSALNSIKNGKGGKDAVFALAKTLEERGVTTNPEEFMEYADVMFRAVNASGGRITPQDFQMAFKYGRLGALGWDQEFLQNYLPRMIQMMKSGNGAGAGGGPGNALMSMYNSVVTGRLGKAEDAWEEAGLLDENGKVRGRETFVHNPGKWVHDELMPSLAAMGITGEAAIIEKIGELFQNRTASFIAGVMTLQGGPNGPFDKDAKLNKQAMRAAELLAMMSEKDYDTIMNNFSSAWTSLLQAIGSPMMEPDGLIMRSLKGITAAMMSLNAFAVDHPDATARIGTALVGLSIGLAAFGAAAVIAGAAVLVPGGAVALAFTALATVLASFAIMNPEKIKNLAGYLPVIGPIVRLFEALSSIGTENLMKAVTALQSLFSTIGTFVVGNYISTIETIAAVFEKIKWFFGLLDLSQYMAPLAKKTNYEGGSDNALLRNAAFNPSNQKQILQPIQIKLDLDGRTLGQAVAEIIEELGIFPTNGGSGNGVQAWNSVGQRGSVA